MRRGLKILLFLARAAWSGGAAARDSRCPAPGGERFYTEVQSNDKCFYTNKHSKGGTGVPPVQAQAKACDYIK
jgi:hypothetical protein